MTYLSFMLTEFLVLLLRPIPYYWAFDMVQRTQPHFFFLVFFWEGMFSKEEITESNSMTNFLALITNFQIAFLRILTLSPATNTRTCFPTIPVWSALHWAELIYSSPLEKFWGYWSLSVFLPITEPSDWGLTLSKLTAVTASSQSNADPKCHVVWPSEVEEGDNRYGRSWKVKRNR